MLHNTLILLVLVTYHLYNVIFSVRNQAVRVPHLQHYIHAAAQSELPHVNPQQPESVYLQGLRPQIQTPKSFQGKVDLFNN